MPLQLLGAFLRLRLGHRLAVHDRVPEADVLERCPGPDRLAVLPGSVLPQVTNRRGTGGTPGSKSWPGPGAQPPRKASRALRRTRRAPVSYTHLRAHETPEHLVCRLLL